MHPRSWQNHLQGGLLILFILGLLTLLGFMLFGEIGLRVTLAGGLLALLLEPAASPRLTLTLYHAQPIPVAAAPRLWTLTRTLAHRAGLDLPPTLHYVPSPLANAFAVGTSRACAIVLSDGLLRRLSRRELAGVLAHEIAHIAQGDLRVMGLADSLSRLTQFLSLTGMLLLLAALPLQAIADIQVNWPALLLLVFAPHLSLLAQLGLSRIREFDADMSAADITQDPEGLALALAHIEQVSRNWRALLLPGVGNPDPSCLRTHPATGERVRRLLALRTATPPPDWDEDPPDWLPEAPSRRCRPGRGGWY